MRQVSGVDRQAKLDQGFSLVELIFVMAITAVIFGTATFLVSAPDREKEIREIHFGIEGLVQRARAMSYSYQQPFVVELRDGEARLMPQASPEDLVDRATREQGAESSALRPLDSMSWPVVFKIDPDYELSIRRWNSANFVPVRGNDVETWVHNPNSPCEPLAIELVAADGLSRLSREYHPLTAKAVDLEMTIGNQ